MMELTESAG